MTVKRRNILTGLAAAPFAALAAGAPAEPPSACTIDEETSNKLNDWPGLGHYAAANEAIRIAGRPVDIIFMGDSITQGWPDKRPGFFPRGRVCRGIGGQTTGQMVLRMMADVVALKPRLVHIMGGTNDIAGNNGPMTPEQTIHNVEAMVIIAKSNGIKAMIGSVPPAANFPWRPGLETARTIADMNLALARLAEKCGVSFIDYTPALSDGQGGMKPGFAYDGVHPDSKGYQAMESVFEQTILQPTNRGD